MSLAFAVPGIRNAVASKLQSDQSLAINRFGLDFRNPIGLAAGFDKNGTAARDLSALGFGFIEVGTVTHKAQPGNPKPRIFRLSNDRALINRLGFNNCGAERLAKNIIQGRPDCILGINIGKSRSVDIDKAIPDYLATFETIYELADYIAINVSSPNTPGLRELQHSDRLTKLLGELQARNAQLASSSGLGHPKPLLIKIAPDLGDGDVDSIAEIALTTGVRGIIATNTTVRREGLQMSDAELKAIGDGGLSGKPLQRRSNEIIASIYRATNGALPIIGVGGVFSATDAWEKICAGASLVQIYTGFVYEGPAIAQRINEGLAAILQREHLNSIDQAVGSNV